MDNTQFQDKAKAAAGLLAAELVQDGMKVGLGTGTTAKFFIEALGKRCKQGLNIKALATSQASRALAEAHGIPPLNSDQIHSLDIAIDGADEIDPKGNMIKGGGGALLREKIVASMARNMVVIVDEKKWVHTLGAFPLPVEISTFCVEATLNHLKAICKTALLRTVHAAPFVTDNGNFIADLHFKSPLSDPYLLNQKLKNTPGVLETGLFLDLAKQIIIGRADGSTTILCKNSDF